MDDAECLLFLTPVRPSSSSAPQGDVRRGESMANWTTPAPLDGKYSDSDNTDCLDVRDDRPTNRGWLKSAPKTERRLLFVGSPPLPFLVNEGVNEQTEPLLRLCFKKEVISRGEGDAGAAASEPWFIRSCTLCSRW